MPPVPDLPAPKARLAVQETTLRVARDDRRAGAADDAAGAGGQPGARARGAGALRR
eukprot:CAMPEP_0174874200 /NCGR_PEP_ID=MMETSP1114-20130205/76285_1 /TAXON_ID=312471 /ORGANISM="Neobodo designis, Strain CCAP 1951/1" /LENGTH=55 /DNA_ID=CAMNT_0016109527 /DNA_START=433 /DNA_END=597 /DNA_ORIENTATION=+